MALTLLVRGKKHEIKNREIVGDSISHRGLIV